MGTLIIDKDEQKYDAKHIEKAIQDLRKSWRQQIWDEEGEVAHIHLDKV